MSSYVSPSPRSLEEIPDNPKPEDRKLQVLARHAGIWLLILVVLLPVWWIITSALSGQNSIVKTMLPTQWSFDNYRTLFSESDSMYPVWVKNTILVCGLSSFFNVLIGAFGAFAFSRLRFKGRRATLMTLLMIQTFPSFLALSAVFYIANYIDSYAPTIGLGTPWILILVYSGGALGINAWLIKGFFDTIPRELDESAMIDGATHSQIFFRVIFPLALPALAVTFMLSFIGTMNDYILAGVLLANNTEASTLAVGLYRFLNTGNAYDMNWGPFTAGALLASVPVVIIFISLQRFIVSGLTAGSVKG